jgi:hypothetical protein
MSGGTKRAWIALLAGIGQLGGVCAVCVVLTATPVSNRESVSCHAADSELASVVAVATCCDQTPASRPALKSAAYLPHALAADLLPQTSDPPPVVKFGGEGGPMRLDASGPPIQVLPNVFRI